MNEEQKAAVNENVQALSQNVQAALSNNKVQAFLFFDNMITPKIITFLYWFLLVVVLVGGVASMFWGGFSFGGFLIALWGIVLGALGVRIWCELLIVLFKMNEALQDIRLRKQ